MDGGPSTLLYVNSSVFSYLSLFIRLYNALTTSVRHVPDWMPGTEFKRIAAKCRRVLDRMVNLPHAFVKQQVVSSCLLVVSSSNF